MASGWDTVTLEKEDALRHLKSREVMASYVKNEVYRDVEKSQLWKMSFYYWQKQVGPLCQWVGVSVSLTSSGLLEIPGPVATKHAWTGCSFTYRHPSQSEEHSGGVCGSQE